MIVFFLLGLTEQNRTERSNQSPPKKKTILTFHHLNYFIIEKKTSHIDNHILQEIEKPPHPRISPLPPEN